MTPDQDLSARLAMLLALANHPDQSPCDAIRYDTECGNAYRSGQLITIADHDRAVQAAVTKAVEAEREACAATCDKRAEELRKYSPDGFGPLGGIVGIADGLSDAIRSRGVAG